MKIELLNIDEQGTYSLGESEIYYRRINRAKYLEIEKRHTTVKMDPKTGKEQLDKNGNTVYEVDAEACTRDATRYIVTGWKGIVANGVEVECTDENKDALPDVIKLRLDSLAAAASITFDEEKKNSTTPSNGSSSSATTSPG